MSNLHQQPKVNVIRAGKQGGARVEEQVTEMDWEDSFVDSFSVNPYLPWFGNAILGEDYAVTAIVYSVPLSHAWVSPD